MVICYHSLQKLIQDMVPGSMVCCCNKCLKMWKWIWNGRGWRNIEEHDFIKIKLLAGLDPILEASGENPLPFFQLLGAASIP